jgi:hypothetical protein
MWGSSSVGDRRYSGRRSVKGLARFCRETKKPSCDGNRKLGYLMHYLGRFSS